MSDLRKILERIIDAHDNIGLDAVCDAIDEAKNVNAYAAMPEIWKRVTNAKKLPVDWYYRKKMGYPPLEEA